MRVEVDRGRCEGHGLCEDRAPAVFQLDEDGELHHQFEGAELPAGLEAAAEAAVGVCPVAALRLLGGAA
jgi:ferredoxin